MGFLALLGTIFAGNVAAGTIQSWYYFFGVDFVSNPIPLPQSLVKLTPQDLCTPEFIFPRYKAPAYVVGLDFIAGPNPYCSVKWNFYPPYYGADRTSDYAIWTGATSINDPRAGMTGDLGVRDQSCPVGDPIMPGTGVSLLDEIDFAAVDSSSLSLTRRYRSSYLVAPQDGFGNLWMHSYQLRLDLQLRQSWYPIISALRPNGEIVRFTTSSGTWIAMDGQSDNITPVLDAKQAIQGWQYKDARNDRIENYDSAGKLTSLQDRNGWTTTLAYSDGTTPQAIAPRANLLIRITNNFGRSIQLTYDANGRISTMVSPDQKTTGYAYTPSGMLASATWPDGKMRTYHYEDSRFPWALTGITDEAGVRFASYAYDEQGRSVNTELAGGVDKVQLQYLGQRQSVVTSADGSSRSMAFELINNILRPTTVSAPCPECGNVAKTTAYDGSGNVSSRVDFENKEARYTYDTRGRETQRIEGYGTADAKTTSTEWHSTWNLPLKIAAPGRVDYFSYDAKGQVLTYGWYPTNNATGSQGLNAQPSGDVTSTTWTYDANGLVATAVDKLGDTVTGQWTFTYDAQGNLASVTNMAGQTGTAVQYDAAGRLLEAVDVNGSRIKYAYDTRGRMTDVDIDGIHTRYEYDAVGQLVGVVGPFDLVTRYTYDAAHRLIQILDNISIPDAVNESSMVSPFSVDGAASPSSLASVSNRLASGWNAVLRWLKDWLSGIISSAYAQTAPPLPNPYAPPLRLGQSIPAYPGSSAAVDLDPSLAPEKATPSLYVMQFLVRVQKTCGEVFEGIVAAFDKSTPPGDCDDDEYTKLKANVDQSCKTGQQYCKAGDSSALLTSKRDALQVCANARRKIMNVCFRGGDKAHQRDWVKVVQQVDICNGL